MRLDAVIFGGGVAGLWLLDRLSRQGARAVLLEAHALGAGQTIASQGIIHGGLKYSLQGLLTRSATNVREMPMIWRDCLAGRRFPDLTQTRVRSQCCYLWQTESVSSRLGMLGARMGLSVSPETLAPEQRPNVLANVPGTVARLGEQVISPAALLKDLATQYRFRILRIDAEYGLEFRLKSPGEVETIELRNPETGEPLTLRPRQVVFTAGAGNCDLRAKVGLESAVMQRRPLHMVMLRGALPEFNGHCVDGARTRVTITSDQDASGQTVWQVGGQIAEDGVSLSETVLMERARIELQSVLPGLDLTGVEWATYRVDRAEGATPNGKRPESVQVLWAGNVTTGWPTKLALAPVLAEEIATRLSVTSSPAPFDTARFSDWPRPSVALPPWDACEQWTRLDRPERQAA